MKRSIKPIGFYDYTVVLTYSGMLFDCAGIFAAIGANAKLSVFFLMLAGFCDMFDGAVASTKKRNDDEKRFGIQIDSLADLIGFGVLPAVFAYVFSLAKSISGIVAALYILAALIRLAYFNVLEENRQRSAPDSKKCYIGVPVTTIALVMPVVYILVSHGIIAAPFAYTLALIPMGCGFLAPFEIAKPRIAGKIAIMLIGAAEAVDLLVFRTLI